MHPLKVTNEKLKDMQAQALAQGLPLNLQRVADLCIEYADELTALLEARGLLTEPAPAA